MANPDQSIDGPRRLACLGLVGAAFNNLFKDGFFLPLLAVLVVLSVFSPDLIAGYPALVMRCRYLDWSKRVIFIWSGSPRLS
jgi:hypothetical protein